jgi:hypothetical protein
MHRVSFYTSSIFLYLAAQIRVKRKLFVSGSTPNNKKSEEKCGLQEEERTTAVPFGG